jgi:hypothetical protein
VTFVNEHRLTSLTRKSRSNDWNVRLCRLENIHEKARKAASKEARKSHEKRVREKERKLRQRLQERQEWQKFWTYEVLQVVVHLDGISDFTPNSSRRNSIVRKQRDIDLQETVSLSITYVVPSASWSPRYELNIKTPSSSGRIVYRAEFQNVSSETWTDTAVVLSTSQTSFSGLDERIPLLSAWHVKLLGGSLPGNKANWTSGLESKSEINAKTTQFMETSAVMGKKKRARVTQAQMGQHGPNQAETQQLAQVQPRTRTVRAFSPERMRALAPPQASLFGASQPPAPAFWCFSAS